MENSSIKLEHKIILDWITPRSSVLDLGCGKGILLSHLANESQVQCQGIEIDREAIHECIAEGLSVFQQDIDTGLSDYAGESFDFCVCCALLLAEFFAQCSFSVKDQPCKNYENEHGCAHCDCNGQLSVFHAIRGCLCL